MATKPLTKAQQAALDEEIDAHYLIEHEETTGIPIKLSEQIISGLDDDEVAMSVLRRIKGRKTAFLFELDEFEDMNELMSRLRDEYQGGDFVIQGRRANGTLAFNQGITIEKPVKKEEVIQPQNNGGNFESILLAMNENSQRQSNETRDLMIMMNEKSAEASRENMTMLFKMMEMNKPAPAANPMGMTEIMAMMVSMKELSAQPVQENPMKLFLQGMEMGKETASGGDESILQSAIKSFGAPLAAMAAMPAAQPGAMPAQPVPAQIAVPAQITGPAPALPLETPQQDNPEMLEKLKLIKEMQPLINTLLKAASTGGDPEVYANFILDQIEPEKIKDFLQNEDTYNQFFTFVQQAQPFREWFDNCRAIVLHYLEQDEKDASGELNNQLIPLAKNVPKEHELQDGEHAGGEQKKDISGTESPAVNEDSENSASSES